MVSAGISKYTVNLSTKATLGDRILALVESLVALGIYFYTVITLVPKKLVVVVSQVALRRPFVEREVLLFCQITAESTLT